MIAIGLGLVAFAVCSFIPVSFWRNWRNVLAGFTLLAIVAVQLFGEEVNGATRWIQFGGLSFQVAELIKLALIVWLAAFLVEKMKNQEITNQTKTLRVLIIILAILGLSVAVMQSDLGSMGVMFAILGLMAFTAGIPMKPIFLILAIVAVGTFAAIASSEYRRERVATFLNPAADCHRLGRYVRSWNRQRRTGLRLLARSCQRLNFRYIGGEVRLSRHKCGHRHIYRAFQPS
jgi:cell division protein FtsW